MALANIYGSNYPLSDRVRTQLYRVLKEDYRGSEVKFKSHFVHGTITLLESLKEKVHIVIYNTQIKSFRLLAQIQKKSEHSLSLVIVFGDV